MNCRPDGGSHWLPELLNAQTRAHRDSQLGLPLSWMASCSPAAVSENVWGALRLTASDTHPAVFEFSLLQLLPMQPCGAGAATAGPGDDRSRCDQPSSEQDLDLTS